MAVKTFTTGEVLTASDTNTYLNNGGLVYISTTTITAGASTVTVSGCYTSTYDRYKVLIQTSSSATGGLTFSMYPNGTTSGNYTSSMYQLATSGTVNTFNTATSSALILGLTGSANMVVSLDNYNAFASIGKTATIQWSSYDGAASYGGTSAYWSTNGTSNTGFYISMAGGQTFGAGTITIYGYRKA
jgi:hypothetical protein